MRHCISGKQREILRNSRTSDLAGKKPMRGELEKAEKKPKKSGISSNGHCEKEGYNGTPDDSASDGGSEEE